MIEPDEEYKKFREILLTIPSKNIDSEEFFKLIMRVLEKLKEQVAAALEEDKEQWLVLIQELYQSIDGAIQRDAEKLSLSEEQLALLSENPNQFSEEQWSKLEAIKEQIHLHSQQIRKLLIKPHLSKEHDSKHKPSEDTKKGSKSPRSKWMRS